MSSDSSPSFVSHAQAPTAPQLRLTVQSPGFPILLSFSPPHHIFTLTMLTRLYCLAATCFPSISIFLCHLFFPYIPALTVIHLVSMLQYNHTRPDHHAAQGHAGPGEARKEAYRCGASYMEWNVKSTTASKV